MSVVQDPKVDVEDKIAGLELLRIMVRFDDKHATTRRLAQATLLRTVLENKNTASSIDKTYDMPVMLLAAHALGDLSAKAATIPEMQNLRKRFLEPSMEWLVRRISSLPFHGVAGTTAIFPAIPWSGGYNAHPSRCLPCHRPDFYPLVSRPIR
jgi:hypothetical protein